MDYKNLSLAVSADLSNNILEETQRILNGDQHVINRNLGVPEVVAIGGLLISCAQFAIQIWQSQSDRTELTRELLEHTSKQAKINTETQMDIIASIVDRLAPVGSDELKSDANHESITKQQWIEEWLNGESAWDDETKRGFKEPSVFMPFADMKYYCVYKNINWTPPNAAKDMLPFVTVPKGFVTDLTSIPRVFWMILTPTGRHGHAAILHDWLYWTQSVSREVADQVFETALAELKVSSAVRNSLFSVVRVFGGRSWSANAEEKARGGKRVLSKMPPNPCLTWQEWQQTPGVFDK